MPLPYIPETITVHLGAPNEAAENVTVSFPDYIKNVASSEIYPTWPENAIRANIYAQVSYALNRIYTEYYRSRGYDFDITNSTTIDQSFVAGRDIFDNISAIVDDIFKDYLVRPGQVQPLFAQ
ncbi:MAG: spore cortex-lytic protein, partial [Clostridia bacterium]|nr:spore cortex-lytic protein [Clostridia bacterium]